jgi:molybdenum cofactor cytidylyltransferase
MKFGPVPIDQAAGKILAHNIPRSDGRRAIRKGKVLQAEDISALKQDGYSRIYTAELENGDLEENLAATQIAAAAVGQGLFIRGAASGKASIAARHKGVLLVNPAALADINACDGIAFATLRTFTTLDAGKIAATIKVIPYALPSSIISQIEQVVRLTGPVLELRAFLAKKVSFLFMGYPGVQKKLTDTYFPRLQTRVEAAGSAVASQDFVQLTGVDDDVVLAQAVERLAAQDTDLIILISETSTMDANDVAPRGIRMAGGEVECVGAPVDPGNLLMIAYRGRIPILGVPGCARSAKTNIVDLILPALLSEIHISRADITRLGHGGLLGEE